jgi:hypothetical protein
VLTIASSIVCRASNIPSLDVEKGSTIIGNNNHTQPKGMTFVNPFTGEGEIEVTCTGYPTYQYGCGINLQDKTLNNFPGTLVAGERPHNNQQKILITSSGTVRDMHAGTNSNAFVLEKASLKMTKFSGNIKNTFYIASGVLDLGNASVAPQATYNFLDVVGASSNAPTLIVNNKTQCQSVKTTKTNFDPTHYQESIDSTLRLNYNATLSVSNPNDKSLLNGEKTNIIEVGPGMELIILA